VVPKEPKIRKLGAAVITRDITLTVPGTHEILMKPGGATSQCHYGSIKHWVVDRLNVYGIKTHKEEVSCKNLGQ
jgi:hypothetical protein